MIWLFVVFGLGTIISSVTKLNRAPTYDSYDSRTNIYKFDNRAPTYDSYDSRTNIYKFDESEYKYKL